MKKMSIYLSGKVIVQAKGNKPAKVISILPFSMMRFTGIVSVVTVCESMAIVCSVNIANKKLL